MPEAPCRARTRLGEPCRAFSLASGYCRTHDPARAEDRRASCSKGGKLRALQGRRRRLDSPPAVVAFLSGLVHDVAEGKLDGEIARTLVYALGVQLRAIELAEQSAGRRLVAEVEQLARQARRGT
jgi:hypothetical protein